MGKDQAAVFKTPSDVGKILARVSGGNPSNIDGTLRTELENSSALSNADLYLINPSGVIFGPNAKLEVGGSFTASTADYVKLKGGGRFDARTPANDVLTAAPVSAFGFLGPQAPAAVRFQQASLAVPAGKGLHVIAGDIAMDGALLTAPAGKITLFSAGSAGETPFDAALPGSGLAREGFAKLGDVHLRNRSGAIIDGSGGGELLVRAGKLTLEQSSGFTSFNYGATRGGSIDVAAEEITLLGGSQIGTTAVASGEGGSVRVEAGTSLTVDGDDGFQSSGIISTTSENATGRAGSIAVISGGPLSVMHGGEISASTGSPARGGDLAIVAESLLVSGEGLESSSILSNAFAGGGDAGNLSITVRGDATVEHGGTIVCSTFGRGRGGNLDFTAASLLIDGFESDRPTGLAVQTGDLNGGDGGTLRVDVPGKITIFDAGGISGSTYGTGRGGSLHIHAGSIQIDGRYRPDALTGIVAQSNPGASGTAGDIEVIVDKHLGMVDGGEISNSTFTSGNGGTVTIVADTLSIERITEGTGFTGITSKSLSSATGDAGNLNVNVAGEVYIASGGQMSTSTDSSGRGGAILLRAGSLYMQGTGTSDILTGLISLSTSTATGRGGDVQVTVKGHVDMNRGSTISCATLSTARGGSITLHAGSLTLDGFGAPWGLTSIEASSLGLANRGGHAGNLKMDVTGAVRIIAGGRVAADTYTSGDGGDIGLKAGSLYINGIEVPRNLTGISATSGSDAPNAGRPGQLNLVVAGAVELISGGLVTENYSQQPGGSITLQAGSLSMAGAPLHEAAISSGSFGGGSSGSVLLQIAGGVSLRRGAFITASTAGGGHGGDLTIRADSLLVDPSGRNAPTGVFVKAFEDSTGDSGTLDIATTGATIIHSGGELSATTLGAGRGGNVTLQADTLTIDGSANPGFLTGITASANGERSGAGGSISISTRRLDLRTGSINTSSFGPGEAGSLYLRVQEDLTMTERASISSIASLSTAGQVELEVGRNLTMDFGSIAVSAFTGDAGDILLGTPRMLVLKDSQILATAGSTGGSITVAADRVVLERSTVSANAIGGNGGRLAFDLPAAGVFGDARDFVIASAALFQSTDSRISASSTFGVQGTLVISAPFVDLAGCLEPLQPAFFDASSQLRDHCARKLQQDFSSYLRLGRGGQAEQAEEFAPAF